jgi:hypothetical protein
MKRTLSFVLTLAFAHSSALFAADAPSASPAPAPAVKLPVQPADVAAPKLGGDGQPNPAFMKAHESFVATAKKGEATVVFLGDSITAGWNGHGREVFKEYAQYNAANLQMPSQYNQATGLTGMGGMGALGTAQQAQGMGRDYLGATSNVYNPTTKSYDASNAVGAFMSPYTQNVIDVQNEAAKRQADIARNQRNAQATRSGAFGGSRQALENAEANRALQSLMNNNQLQGQQAAYQSALQNMQYGAGLGLQGLNTAQQGYGMAGQAGTSLANIGNQQLGAQQGILGLQQQVGGQQQAQEQQIINQNIQNYANQQQAPMQAYNQYNALLRGYAIPGMTTTQYQAAPSMTSQIAGLGTAAAGAYGLMKRAGGTIKEPKGQGIDTLGLRNALNAGK